MGEKRGELGLCWEEKGSRNGEGVAEEIWRVVGGFYGVEGESGGHLREVLGGEKRRVGCLWGGKRVWGET